ncbi:4-hydroxy-tetrahydrodipicolinate synthase [compost metagenome]
MFTGLSAFPLTPMKDQRVDEASFIRLVTRLVEAGVDSIGALGSTGSYAYLTRTERARVAELAVQHAGNVPVMVSIGASGTREVLQLAEDAQKAGVNAVLLAPVSYQKLTGEEVFDFYKTVSESLSVPMCVYDNPGTTHFDFTDELHGRIAHLPNVRSIKIPGVPTSPIEAKSRVDKLRALIPFNVTIGISGDATAATGLNAGCDAWYSVIGGLFPEIAVAITRAAQQGNFEEALRRSNDLQPIWDLFRECGGSLRVVATAAELKKFVSEGSLPLPLKSVSGDLRLKIGSIVDELKLK